MKIVFASNNEGKLVEMKKMLAGFDVISAAEAGFYEDVVEDQNTFSGNALKKARAVALATKQWAVADDSGICIKALNWEPGVFSARFLNNYNSQIEAMAGILEKMKAAQGEDRHAYFESAVALVTPDGEERIFSGRVSGRIAEALRGKALPKLPYDLIFIPEGYEQTFAEMGEAAKNSISHRGQAFRKLKEYLNTIK